jgi:O-antigen/teichoic acid export membrane protein
VADHSLTRRFIGFTTVPLLSFVAPLLVLPIVARIGGVEGWASIGIGQSIGAFGVYTTGFGWNVVGSARIALEPDDAERRHILAQSLRMRLLAFVVTAVVLGTVSYLLAAPGFRFVAALTAAATAFGGMTISWYGVGMSRPSFVLTYETVPMMAAMLCAIPLLLLTRALLVYPLLLIAAPIVGLSIMILREFRADRGDQGDGRIRRGVWGGFRTNLGPAVIDATGGAYSSAPIPVARLTQGVSAAAGVASADKIYRFGLTAVVIVGNALQSWVLECAVKDGRYRRQLVAIVVHAALGIVGLLVLWLGGRWITAVLFGGAVVPAESVFLWYGLAYLCISASTPFIRNILIPGDRTRIVLGATIASAVVGLAAMIAFGLLWGVTGVAAALALSELVIVGILAVPGIRIVRAQHATAARAGAGAPDGADGAGRPGSR